MWMLRTRPKGVAPLLLAAFALSAMTVLACGGLEDDDPESSGATSAALDLGGQSASRRSELVPCGAGRACSTSAAACPTVTTSVGAGSCEGAMPISSAGCSTYALSGTTQHWFKFTVPASGTWLYNFSTLGAGDTSCRVYTTCGARPMAGYSENLSPTDFNCRGAPAGGFEGRPGATYFVRVSGAGSFQPNLSMSTSRKQPSSPIFGDSPLALLRD